MEGKVKCKKCGRVLKNPLSIAMGMGPKCAGVSVTQGKGVKLRSERSSGKAYPVVSAGSAELPLIQGQPEKNLSRKELARLRKEERRRLFEQRLAFQCGVLSGSRIPLVYEPAGDGEWRDKVSGRLISHEHLRSYLVRYRLI